MPTVAQLAKHVPVRVGAAVAVAAVFAACTWDVTAAPPGETSAPVAAATGAAAGDAHAGHDETAAPAAPTTPAAPPADPVTTVPAAAPVSGLPAASPDVDPAGATPWAFPAGADVVVEAGQKVLVDRTVDAGDVVVRAGGALLLADRDLTLSARSIVVHGTFQAGTMAAPLTADVTVRITDTDASRSVMGMGPGVFGTMDAGVVKLYGARGREGTVHLAATAPAGATTLTLTAPLPLVPGDVVLVGATGFEPSESERCTVAAAAGTQVTCAAPLAHEHLGTSATFGDHTVDLRAPVALLTRNLVLTASPEARAAGVHGHTHFTGTGAAEVVGVQAVGLGNAGALGQYPFHLHNKGRATSTAPAFVAYSSAVDSANRAFVVHLSDGVTVLANVADQVSGHAFMIGEDGPETGSVVTGNLSTRVTAPVEGARLRESDANPANFWFGSAAHDVRDNEAAGAEGGWGFLVEEIRTPVGLAATQGRTEDTRYFPLGVWERNTAHSISEPEPAHVCAFFGCGTGVGVFTRQPVRPGSDWRWGGNGDELGYTAGVPYGLPEAVIRDTTVWKAEGFGVWAGRMLGFERLRVLDTRDGLFGNQVLVDDSLFVGGSGVGEQYRGGQTGVVHYDGHRDVKDTLFVNYADQPDRRSAAFGVFGSYTEEEIGFYGVSAVENVTLSNATPVWISDGDDPERVVTRDGDVRPTIVFWDLDGSVTGLGARSYVTFGSDPTGGCQAVASALAKYCPFGSAAAEYVDDADVNRLPPASLPEIG